MALQQTDKPESESAEKGRNKTECAVRRTVHLFSPLSEIQDFVLENHHRGLCFQCPCSCEAKVKYNNTSIGNLQTWYGRFDILLGNYVSVPVHIYVENTTRQRTEIEQCMEATVVLKLRSLPQDSDPNSSDEDDNSSQPEVKTSNLEKNMSQLIS